MLETYKKLKFSFLFEDDDINYVYFSRFWAKPLREGSK